MDSIMQDDNYCYLHRKYLGLLVQATDSHHCLGGNKRKLAEQDGLKVNLCRECHRKLHDNLWHFRDLQQEAEQRWLDYNNASIEDFIKRYGKNFI